MTFSVACIGILGMIVLHITMHGEDVPKHMACAMCLHSSMQEEDILEHTNAKCCLGAF